MKYVMVELSQKYFWWTAAEKVYYRINFLASEHEQWANSTNVNSAQPVTKMEERNFENFPPKHVKLLQTRALDNKTKKEGQSWNS